MRIFGHSKASKTKPDSEIHKHPFAIFITAFLLVFFGACVAFISLGGGAIDAEDKKLVQVHVDGQTYTLPTHAPTVRELLDRLNIQLKEGDIVEPNINSPILDDNFNVNVYRSRPITIIDENGQRTTARIAESSPRELAKKAGVELFPEDKVEFGDPDKAVEGDIVGDLITINRAVEIKLNLYGKKIPARTHATTVSGMLKEKNIELREKDTLKPAGDTPIMPGMEIFVLTNGKRIVTEEEVIPAPVETEYDATMKVGEIKVVDPGKDGQKVVTYEVKFVNGKETARKEIQSVVSVEPQVRKVIEGTKSEGFGGGFDAALAALRSCEGGYTSVNPAGYYGAYQFNLGSWSAYAPAAYKNKNPIDSPPAVQDQAARNYYMAAGWRPWPSCSVKLGLQDIYR